MGFPIEAFTTPPDEEFVCAICLEVMETPLMVGICEHIYCRECLARCNGNCPLDRTTIGRVRAPHRSFTNTLGRLQIRCRFSNADVDGVVSPGGCTHIGNVSDIRKHEEKCPHKNNKKTKFSFPPWSKPKSVKKMWPWRHLKKNEDPETGTETKLTERIVYWKQKLQDKDAEIQRLTSELESYSGSTPQRALLKAKDEELKSKSTEINRLTSELESSKTYADNLSEFHLNSLQTKNDELEEANAEIWRLNSMLWSSDEGARFRQERLELLTLKDELTEKEAEIRRLLSEKRTTYTYPEPMMTLKHHMEVMNEKNNELKEAKAENCHLVSKLEVLEETIVKTEAILKRAGVREQFCCDMEQQYEVQSTSTSKVKFWESAEFSDGDALEVRERSLTRREREGNPTQVRVQKQLYDRLEIMKGCPERLENKPNGKIALQVHHISTTSNEVQTTSDKTYFQGMFWYIVVTLRPFKSLEVQLRCNGKVRQPNWRCDIIANFRIHSYGQGEDVWGRIAHRFNAHDPEKGIAIDWTSLTGERNVLVEDSIDVEVEIFEVEE